MRWVQSQMGNTDRTEEMQADYMSGGSSPLRPWSGLLSYLCWIKPRTPLNVQHGLMQKEVFWVLLQNYANNKIELTYNNNNNNSSALWYLAPSRDLFKCCACGFWKWEGQIGKGVWVQALDFVFMQLLWVCTVFVWKLSEWVGEVRWGATYSRGKMGTKVWNGPQSELIANT